MSTQPQKRNMVNPAAFIGKRVDSTKWQIPEGYDRCEMTGKLYPHSQLECTFQHVYFDRNFLIQHGIYVENAAWLSEEGYDLIMAKLDDLGVLDVYRAAFDHEQDFIDGRCEIGAAGLVWTNQAPAAAVTTSSTEPAAEAAPAPLPAIFFNGLVLTIDGEEVVLLYRDGRFGFYTDEQYLNPILAALAERFDDVTADRKELAPGLVNYRVSFKTRPVTVEAALQASGEPVHYFVPYGATYNAMFAQIAECNPRTTKVIDGNVYLKPYYTVRRTPAGKVLHIAHLTEGDTFFVFPDRATWSKWKDEVDDKPLIERLKVMQ